MNNLLSAISVAANFFSTNISIFKKILLISSLSTVDETILFNTFLIINLYS